MKKKKGEVKVATKTPRHQGFFIIYPLVYLCAFVPWWLFSLQFGKIEPGNESFQEIDAARLITF